MHLLAVGILLVLQIFLWLLVARMVLSWIRFLSPRLSPSGFVAVIFEVIYTLTDPPLKFLGRFIPPLRVGAVAIDTSFMVLFFLILVLRRVVIGLFY